MQIDYNELVNSEIPKEYHGTEYGGWFISPINLNENSIVYSFGAGEDISFDLSIIRKYGLNVYAFDPTPRSIEFVKKQNIGSKFHFYEFGIASYDGTVKFYPPENPSYISHTLLHRSSTENSCINVPVKRLETICKMLNHKKIHLLKMDIEGAEYSVLEDILKSGIEIEQILVEFHDRFEGVEENASKVSIKNIIDNGFNLFSISSTGNEFSFIKNSNTAKERVILDHNQFPYPVILMTYNRPEHTKKVIDALKEYNIKNLIVFSDAPKTEKDIGAVNKTRVIIEKIDWTTPVKVFQTENKGLARSIIDAVDLVFKTYDKLVLLEDDCVPQKYFFDFMYTCLDKYENNEKIFGISGYTVPISDEIQREYHYDAYFFPRIGSWGWGTWKRAWKHKFNDLHQLKAELIKNGIDINQGGSDVPSMLQQMLEGSLKDVWTMSWLLTVYLKHGYFIYPIQSHINNIGMDGSGIHCGATNKYETILSNSKPLHFPDKIIRNQQIDNNFRKYYDINTKPISVVETSIKKLKVVHLCSQDFGGAGIAAYRLHKGLQAIGVDSTMLVLDKKSGDPSVKVIPDYQQNSSSYCSTPDVYSSIRMKFMWGYWAEMLKNYPNRPNGLEIFTDGMSSVRLDLIKEIADADIVNLHWVAGMVDFKELPKALKDKKIVWTLHDMNAFTGGCHYSSNCKKYITSCESCPQLGSQKEHDLSKEIFNIKNESYGNLELNIVTPSKWLGEEVKQSYLFSKFNLTVVPNGLSLNVYKPVDRLEVRKWANIPEYTKVVLFGADYLTNKRKGFRYLINALNKIDENETKNIVIVTFGFYSNNLIEDLKFKTINLGNITNERILATIYGMADVFVIPSIEDNFPNTLLESLSSGTPVVGFNTGGISEVIVHKKNGYLAENGNTDDLANGILWILHNKNSEIIRKFCRLHAEKNYDVKMQANTYLKLYESLLSYDRSTKMAVINNDTKTKQNININDDVVIATTIAPKNIEKQVVAVNSWINAGFRVISINTKSEISYLKKYFLNIKFIPVEKNAAKEYGKPFIYLDDIFNALLSTNCKICGIINSDIILNVKNDFADYIKTNANSNFVYGSRLDILENSSKSGKYYELGFDFFFFNREVIKLYPKTKFCLGLPWWDYWMVILPMLKNVNTCRLVSQIALHIWHETNYEYNYWLNLGNYFIKLLKNNDILDISNELSQEFDLQYVNSIVTVTLFQKLYKFSKIINFNSLKKHYSFSFPTVKHNKKMDALDFFHSFFLTETNQQIKRNTKNFTTENLNRLLEQGLFEELYLKLWYAHEQYPDDLVLLQYYIISNFYKNEKDILAQDYFIRILNIYSVQDPVTKNIFNYYIKMIKGFDKHNNIRVSAIVSTYNSERFIDGCLSDLVEQTLFKKGQLEIIIIDSASEQNEDIIIEKYQKKYENIKYFKTKQRETIYQAWNIGILASIGDYITNANTDDRHKNDALEILANELDNYDSIGLVYADSKVTSNENESFETAQVSGYLLWPEFDPINLFSICYVGPQPMWRRNLHEKYGYFDGSYKSAGDYEFWLRLVKKEKFKHINKILGLYLLSDGSIEHENQEISLEESAKARMKHWESKSEPPQLFGTYLSYYECSVDLPKSVEFSVIIPTCDRPEYLRDALNSLSSQTYKDFEVIVVNDGKIDVIDILKESMGTLHYQYLRHIVNRERSASRNNGIKISRGKYILFLDDDDLFYSDHLKTLHNNLNNDTLIVYTDAVRAKYEKTETGYKLINKFVPYSIDYERNKLLIGNLAPINCFAIPRTSLFKAGLFNERINVLEDWELLLRLSEIVSFKHVRTNTCEISWRTDGSSTTSSRGNEFDAVRKQIYNKYDSEIRNISNITEIVNEFNSIWKNDFAISAPLVSIIALSYNQHEYTKQFVESVLKHTKTPFELIIIDNGSSKETVDYVKSLGEFDERIKLVLNSTNLGFPKGINQGIKFSTGSYIVIANNDIVVTEGWLERMIEVAESNEKIGIVGPASNAVSGVQLDKEAKYSDIKKMHEYAKRLMKKNSGKTLEFPRVAFLCTLIKREVIGKIGGLDERFTPGNFEDDDFCLRAQMAGFKTIIAQDVFIHHYGSKSFTAEGSDKYRERLVLNQKKFIDKWGGTPEDIWLNGKQIKGRNIMITLNKNGFVENLERAMSLIEDKDYAPALGYLENSIENYNDFNHGDRELSLVDLLNLTGNIYMLSGDVEKARDCFEKALNEDSSSAQACCGLGDVLFNMKNYEAAKTMYEWSIKNDLYNKAAVDGLEKTNSILNLSAHDNSLQRERKENTFVNTGSIDEEADTDKLIADAYQLFNEKDFGKALEKLNKAERLFNGHLSNPTDSGFASSFHNMKGFVYLGMNDITKAKECFEKALNLDPGSSQACAGLGEILFLTEKDKQSKTMFEWAVKNNPNNMFAVGGLQKINKLLGFPVSHSTLDESNENTIKIDHRDQFGYLFNKIGLLGKGAEIGVQEGVFSKTLRDSWKGEELYLIDWWKYSPDYKDIANVPDDKQKEFYLSVVNKFANDRSVQIIRKDSVTAANQFPDKYFDWIYLDADHSFQGCSKDIQAWYPKLKHGGIFAGHDYIDGNFVGGVFGVKSAVDKFIMDTGIELFTTEEKNLKSWYFVKPAEDTVASKTQVIPKNKNINDADSQKLQSVLNEILEASFDLFGLKFFDEALDTLKKSEELFYSQESIELTSAFENLKGFNYLGMDEKEKARECFETALSLNNQSSQACAGLGELFYLEGKDKEAKTMYEYAVVNNPDNQFAIGGLEKVNGILGYSSDHNSLELKK